MQRLLIAATILFSATLASAEPPAEAPPPGTGGERVNQLIVYGEDPCPQSTGDEITVCARKDEGERYRIPEPLRDSSSPQNDAWNNRVVAYETVGRTGTLSCSPVGGGGSTGCLQNLIDKAYAERETDPNVRFSQLIAEERARRLSTIDADAAETQGRVEQIEKEYDARQRAQQDAETQAQQPASTPAAPAVPPASGQ